jgi:DNA primase
LTNVKVDFDDIRRQIDIVQVISSYIPLTKKGKNYMGVCPFHDDTNPSMSVSPDKQIYKCFSCGASGNVFTFVKEIDNLEFIPAVKKAADIVGLKLNMFDSYKEKSSINEKDEPVYKVLDEVNRYYKYLIKVKDGENAFNYLKNRKIDENIIEHFNIGYCLDDAARSIKFLKSKGHSVDNVITSGIGVERGGEIYDRMSGRITFAITDEYNRVVGFSGRRLNEALEQKYLNSPETILFHKSKLLYNFYNGEKAARRAGHIYIVEGFMDVIALYRIGIENAIATMGTAMTNDHYNLLSKINLEIRLMLDSDDAGQNATFKALDVLSKLEKRIKIVKKFSQAKDIDELVNNQPETVKQELEQTISAMEFRINYLYNRINKNNYEERKEFARKAATYLTNPIFDKVDQDYYITLISKLSNFNKNLVEGYLKEFSPKPINLTNKFKQINQQKYIDRYGLAERQVISKILDSPNLVEEFHKKGIIIHDSAYRKILAYLTDYYESNGIIVIADIVSNLEKDLGETLIEISEEDYPPMTVDELINILVNEFPNSKSRQETLEKINEISDPKEQAQIARKLIDSMKKKIK